ncbi:MAG TPA: efflux RND transporter periplasmic adaptor subunit [Steroidobacteraceae bacterium]|nr:efflux RND transporter periplasmic adaptor subunit [Steroidobacteraceae bacterium]
MTAATPSVAVSAAMVRRADLPVAIEAIGAAQAWQSDTIHAQISGRLLRVAVPEGTQVKAGDLIAQIDPAPFRAALLQSQGALERDQAQLDLARLELGRDRVLLSQDSIAVQQVDAQQAMVKGLEGTVRTDQGAVDAARVNLAYCTITSPISGWVGVRLVDPGNLVSPTDSTGIVTINQIEPIAVTFSVPEGDFQRLRQASDMFERPLETQAYSQDTGVLSGTGTLRIADNHVDPATGSVVLKARFANTDRRLWPGQFVNVHLTLNVLHDALTIPNAAVNQGPEQAYAYVIGADHHVSVRPIKVTLVQDATAVIGSGLAPGETVVTDGQMELTPGAVVLVRGANSATSAAVR